MRIFKTVLLTVLALWNLSGLSNAFANSNSQSHRVVVAYVTSWSEIMPDPMYMTHINYAFGHVNETFNGVRVDNPVLSRMVIAFLPGSKHLSVSQLQSPSTVILEPKKIKSVIFYFFPHLFAMK